ncbi:hypothetical protein BDZ45DRAFT_141487 [Acephala macrosclerotiorum]|nr:hypothetical protein BDZ45DRAFT_141487 [Acephala macrosclerotiorum]
MSDRILGSTWTRPQKAENMQLSATRSNKASEGKQEKRKRIPNAHTCDRKKKTAMGPQQSPMVAKIQKRIEDTTSLGPSELGELLHARPGTRYPCSGPCENFEVSSRSDEKPRQIWRILRASMETTHKHTPLPSPSPSPSQSPSPSPQDNSMCV